MYCVFVVWFLLVDCPKNRTYCQASSGHDLDTCLSLKTQCREQLQDEFLLPLCLYVVSCFTAAVIVSILMRLMRHHSVKP